MKVYLSGPISLGGTLSPDEVTKNLEAFKNQKNNFESQGYTVIDPSITTNSDWLWIDYMEAAIKMLSEADLIFLMDGWEKSPGCRIEATIAKHFHIPELG
jgi:hypothetical protein